MSTVQYDWEKRMGRRKARRPSKSSRLVFGEYHQPVEWKWMPMQCQDQCVQEQNLAWEAFTFRGADRQLNVSLRKTN